MRTKKIKNTVKPLDESRVITRTIGQLKNEEHFELYFDQETFDILSKHNWKDIDRQKIPKRMLEIMQIGYETYRGKLPLKVNVTHYNTDAVFLWYLVLFLKGEVSAGYKTYYISFNQASQKFKDNILNTKLEISTLSSAVPSVSVGLFGEYDNTLQNASSIKPIRYNCSTSFPIGTIVPLPILATHYVTEGGLYNGTEVLYVDHKQVIKLLDCGLTHTHWVRLDKDTTKKEQYNVFDPTFLQEAKEKNPDFFNFIEDLAETYRNRGKQNVYRVYLHENLCNIKFVVGEMPSSEQKPNIPSKSTPLFEH